MQYLENTTIICLTYDEFVPGIMPKGTYDSAKSRESIIVHGRGGNGNTALIEFETLPPKYKALVEDKFGNPYKYFVNQPLIQMVEEDMKARAYYAGYQLPDGRPLPYEYQNKCARQCDWLNMIGKVLADKKALKEQLKISIAEFWSAVIALHQNDTKYNPELPTSEKRLKERLKLYELQGYGGLIDVWRFNNSFARKVDKSIERLILSLYARHDKPYFTTVVREYQAFMNGEFELVDFITGEMFDPATYMVNGEPYMFKEDLVKYYIEKPLNRAAVDKLRMSALEWNTKHRPHHMRKAPTYALSKLTMDDISLPFKMPNNERPWSYQVFDVASQAVIGVSFGRDKSQDLILEAVRDMFRNVLKHSWISPLEIEVEQHLNAGLKGKKNEAGDFEAGLLTENTVFPFVRFCAARNPQEKRAEGFIELKKYGIQKKREGFHHRPHARKEANRANEDAKLRRYTYEQIINNELADIQTYNNELHPNQVDYPGLTRWQVLTQNINPNGVPVNLALMLPYVGYHTKTSISRQFVQVQYKKYALADLSVLERLTSEKVNAYYLTDDNGDVSYVHLYTESGDPICEAVPVERYQEAKAERTEKDEQIRSHQAAYIARFDKMVAKKVADISPVGVIATDKAQEITSQATPVKTENEGDVQDNEANEGGYVQENGSSIPWFLDPNEVKRRAHKGI